MKVKRLAPHALLWGGLAAMVGGLYMLAGTGWAVLVGGFVAYATGYDLLSKQRAVENARRFEDVHNRVSESIEEARRQAAGGSAAALQRAGTRALRPPN